MTTHDTHPARTPGRGPRDTELIVAWASLAAFAACTALAVSGLLRSILGNDGKRSVYAWFSPEPYVQLIWVPIFVLAALWLLRQSHEHRKAPKGGTLMGLTVPVLLLIAACLVGIAWQIAWQVESYPTAITLVLVEAVLVGALFFFSRRQGDGWIDWIPFSLWGAWIMVECVVDIARAATYYLSKDGPLSSTGQAVATVVVTALLLALACALRFMNHDWVYGLVTVWSVVGIAFRLMDVSKVTAVLIIILATLAMLLMYVPWSRFSPRLTDLDARAHAPADGTRTHDGPMVIESHAGDDADTDDDDQ
ncbi:hypothetical protein [Bifidobacterium cuniculi]|uniref:Uncharacterized protein n=1 Tax=Bifidobacterium cuniculi TaxID=1688 RepID=A0A087B4P8_9BIFI|nr:hypothetical protein [Bifidobacterium cuniculi]KFI65998.1 hypothetical protein BCUN_0498 [Bifidobacterium cuniculi]